MIGLLLLLAADPGALVLVARDVEAARALTAGDVLPAGASVVVGPDGFAELVTAAGVRVRVAAGTRARIGDAQISVEAGRVAIEAARVAVGVELGDVSARVEAPGAAIAESLGGRALVLVRAGRVVVGDQTILRGQLFDGTGVRAAGGALLELASFEARAARGDFDGLWATLLARTLAIEVAAPTRTERGPGSIFDPEVFGGGASPADRLLEEALRPPPFYGAEVPPPGPNVVIEVEYED